MTINCVCGEVFNVVDQFTGHIKSCAKYLEAVKLKDNYKDIIKEVVKQLEEGIKTRLGQLATDYDSAKDILSLIEQQIKDTSKDKAAIVQAIDPNIYESALEALMIGTMALKEFKKLYGIPPVEALTKLMNLGRITVKEFKKLTGTAESILSKINKESLKKHTERIAAMSIVGICTYFLAIAVYSAVLGTIPHPLVLLPGSLVFYFALRKFKLVRELQNGKV